MPASEAVSQRPPALARAASSRHCAYAARSFEAAALAAELARRDRIIAPRVLFTDIAKTSIKTNEKGMRSDDGSFAALLLIEGLDQAAVRYALHHVRATLPVEQQGPIDALPLYRLAFSLPKRLLAYCAVAGPAK